jgi:hypothetical protein
MAALIVAAGSLSGCSAIEYHGYDSGIDGTLWRQIAAFEDPVNFYDMSMREPLTYLAELGVTQWDGSTSTVPDLSEGTILLYDVSTTEITADFSVFISSGHRPSVQTDDGHDYVGRSEVYTCYGLHANFSTTMPTVERTISTTCSAVLVKKLPSDAAFASGDVFDG